MLRNKYILKNIYIFRTYFWKSYSWNRSKIISECFFLCKFVGCALCRRPFFLRWATVAYGRFEYRPLYAGAVSLVWIYIFGACMGRFEQLGGRFGGHLGPPKRLIRETWTRNGAFSWNMDTQRRVFVTDWTLIGAQDVPTRPKTSDWPF